MDTYVGGQPSSVGRLASHEVKYITLLSLTEIGFGSLVHGLKIPLGGHGLSLNQGFVLMQASRAHNGNRISAARSSSHISLITALMKSFSPAGKKLTPMLAITVQGLLFSTGIFFGGLNFLGYALAMILLSVWGFAQPLLMAWLFVGIHFWDALNLLWQKIAEPIGLESIMAWRMILLFVAVKALLAVGLVFVSDSLADRWNQSLLRKGEAVLRGRKSRAKDSVAPTHQQQLARSLKDLLSPLVVISVLLSVVFAWFSDSTQVGLISALLRPLTAAFVGFYLLRIVPTERLVRLFAKNNPHRALLIRKVSESIERFAR